MVRWKVIWRDALENARCASNEKWAVVVAIVALMLVVGAFALGS